MEHLKSKTVVELRSLAKKLELRGYSKLRKDELVKLIHSQTNKKSLPSGGISKRQEIRRPPKRKPKYDVYESMIIGTPYGEYPTTHDFCRLDLDLKNKTFVLHRYSVSSESEPYLRTMGNILEIKKIDPKPRILRITLKPTETILKDNEKEYLKKLKTIYDILESRDLLIKMSTKYTKLVETSKKVNFPRNLVFYADKDMKEIKTDRYPFGNSFGPYKKIILNRA